MNTDCVFCKIVAGELPSTRIMEDEVCLAFMDIGPIVRGHVLVIPKAHGEFIADVPADVLGRIMGMARQVAVAQQEGLKADGVNLHLANGAVAGQVVPHLHLHVIPRFEDDGHAWNWQANAYADADAMNACADAIRDAL